MCFTVDSIATSFFREYKEPIQVYKLFGIDVGSTDEHWISRDTYS